ncbi:MAG TPA: hypothetical protein VF411_07765 [Bacteroidia bacterium]
MRLFYILLFAFFFQSVISQNNCNCNESEIAFSDAYVNSNQLIFRGKTLSVSKGTDYDKVTFVVGKLFKGTAAKEVTVYIDAKNPCALKFNVGEDWLIYAGYKQAKPVVANCSRSRKNVINTNKNVDLMYVKIDISVDEETAKLTELCGLKAFTQAISSTENAHNNIIPTSWQRIVLIIISLLSCMGIYFLLNKYWRK